ncbi:MAG TPA: hypothetical protein VF824_12450 [Thermoanaerobaculia bacterium]|jgi:hypothetical protein
MRKLGLLLFVSLLAFPTLARPARRAAQARVVTMTAVRLADGAAARTALAAHLRAMGTGRVGAKAIVDNSSMRTIAIPAAGSVRGANGTFFRSDVTFVNYNFTQQKVIVYWLPNGGGAAQFLINVNGEIVAATVEDFVGTTLRVSGLGSLLFVPVRDDGITVDDDAAIDIFSRIWTPQPNAVGTVSQPFPGVSPGLMFGRYEGVLLGVRQDAGYRTNVGIVNYGPVDVDFDVTVAGSGPGGVETFTMRVSAFSFLQQPLPAGDFGSAIIIIDVDPQVDAEDTFWLAYASSTDNISGDGWVTLVSRPLDDDDLDSEGR